MHCPGPESVYLCVTNVTSFGIGLDWIGLYYKEKEVSGGNVEPGSAVPKRMSVSDCRESLRNVVGLCHRAAKSRDSHVIIEEKPWCSWRKFGYVILSLSLSAYAASLIHLSWNKFISVLKFAQCHIHIVYWHHKPSWSFLFLFLFSLFSWLKQVLVKIWHWW